MPSRKGKSVAEIPNIPKNVKPGDTVELFGLKLNIASDEECEQADAVVCAPVTVPLYFRDNIVGPCADCGDMLQWRPHAPKKPPKICMRCIEIREISRKIKEAKEGRKDA